MSQIAHEADSLHGHLGFSEEREWLRHIPQILELIRRLDERIDGLGERLQRVLETNDLWSGE